MKIVNLLGGDVPALAGEVVTENRRGLVLRRVEAISGDGVRANVDGVVMIPWSAVAFVQDLG